jgi:hypothetical protein
MSGFSTAWVSPAAFLKAPRASFAKRAFACTDVSVSGILLTSPSLPSSPPSAASSASLCALRLARSAACRACLDLSRGKVLLLLLFRCLLLRPLPGEVGCRARLNFASRFVLDYLGFYLRLPLGRGASHKRIARCLPVSRTLCAARETRGTKKHRSVQKCLEKLQSRRAERMRSVQDCDKTSDADA